MINIIQNVSALNYKRNSCISIKIIMIVLLQLNSLRYQFEEETLTINDIALFSGIFIVDFTNMSYGNRIFVRYGVICFLSIRILMAIASQ